MTLSDPERLSEIFNDKKHRAASLRQLSSLLLLLVTCDAAVGGVKVRLELWITR